MVVVLLLEEEEEVANFSHRLETADGHEESKHSVSSDLPVGGRLEARHAVREVHIIVLVSEEISTPAIITLLHPPLLRIYPRPLAFKAVAPLRGAINNNTATGTWPNMGRLV